MLERTNVTGLTEDNRKRMLEIIQKLTTEAEEEAR
jgi:hypothetical protein